MLKRYSLVFLVILAIMILLPQTTLAAKKTAPKWQKATEPLSFPILMYHSIENKPGNRLCVPPEQLEQQLKYLHDNGYYTLTPAEAYKALTENKRPRGHKKMVLVSFDDGYEDNYTNAWPLLKKYQIRATIALITSKVGTPGMLTLEQIKHLQKSKWITFVSHTQNHHELNRLNEAEQQSELQASKDWFKQTLQHKTDFLVYPVGRYNEISTTLAQKVGYKLALTTQPGLATKAQGLYELHRQRVVPDMSLEAFSSLLTK